MCTLIVLHCCLPGAPLVVAANRDEFMDRPAEGPKLRETPHGPIVAPRDVRAGGTWLGVNGSGVFAALTNRRCEDPDPQRRSRGLLVMDALAASSAADAAKRMRVLNRRAYNPFNLVVADRFEAHVVTYDESPHHWALDPGVHVVGNVAPGTATPKIDHLQEAVEKAAAGRPDTLVDRLAEICRGHDGGGDALRDTCVHAGPYGTRSSTLLWLGREAGESVLRFSEGPPCENEYEDFTPLLRRLERSSASEGANTTREAS